MTDQPTDEPTDKAEHDEPTAAVGSPEADALLVPHGDGTPDVKTDAPDGPGADKAERDEPTAAVGSPEADALLVPHGAGAPDVKDGVRDETAAHAAEQEQGHDEGHGLIAYPMLKGPRTHRVLVYSSEQAVRDRVKGACGSHPAADLGTIVWSEAATGKQVVAALDAGGLDLVILDGEARPTGGLGLSKQLKDEIKDCPPFVALVARKDDRWLATWSLADAIVTFPLDAPDLTAVVAEQLRARESGLPVKRAYA